LFFFFFFLPLLYLSVRFSKYTPRSLILGILSLLRGKDSGNMPSLLANCGKFMFPQPQSKRGNNQFGGLGATIIDSLDTLYIMGLKAQYEKARE